MIGFISAIVIPGPSIESYCKPLFEAVIGTWLCGTIFRWYSISTLGRFFTYDVAVSRDQPVVQQGSYRWLRHPSYLGSLPAVIGYGMTLTNWLAILSPALCLGAAYAYRIRVEEQALLQGLGLPYHEYMKRAGRVIPLCSDRSKQIRLAITAQNASHRKAHYKLQGFDPSGTERVA